MKGAFDDCRARILKGHGIPIPGLLFLDLQVFEVSGSRIDVMAFALFLVHKGQGIAHLGLNCARNEFLALLRNDNIRSFRLRGNDGCGKAKAG